MKAESLMSAIITEIDKKLPSEDLLLFHEFLSNEETELAIEYMCDRLFEHEIVVSQRLGQMLIVLAGKIRLSPYRTWRGIWVEGDSSGEKVLLNLEFPDLQAPVLAIFEKVRDRMEPDVASLMQDYLTQWEIELAVDDMFHALIYYKIPISQKEVDTLRSIWLDLGHNPAELTGFLIQKEEKK
jgi:hypothetical protein